MPALAFGDLLERHGVPHYLKTDIEGADLLCLETLDPAESPTFVSIESDKISWAGLVHELDLLERLGYRRFKVIGQHKVSRQRAPKPAREGHYVRWSFRHGSSGLFGAETPGRWLSRHEALAKYRLFFVRYRLYGDTGLLPRRGAAAALRARFGCSAAAPGGSTPTPAGNGNWEILLQVTSAETTRAHTDTRGRSIRRRSSDSPHQGRTEAIRVGASQERVNRTLASVVRLGSLDQHNRRYVIVERDRRELRAR